jgi:hypothetical protein
MSSAPDFLSGDDGETVFVRGDLALSAPSARNQAFVFGCNVQGMEVDLVEMLPVPEHFTELDVDWAVVREGTEGAVTYWRFRV